MNGPETERAGAVEGGVTRRADLIEAGKAAYAAGAWPLLIAGLAMLAAARGSWWAVAGGVALTVHEWAMLERVSKGGGWRRGLATAAVFLLPFCAMLGGTGSPHAVTSVAALYAAGLAAVPTVAWAVGKGLEERGLGRLPRMWWAAYGMALAGVGVAVGVYVVNRQVSFAGWGWTRHAGEFVAYFRLVLLFPFCAVALPCVEGGRRFFAGAAVTE